MSDKKVSRRDFIKSGAAGTVALATLGAIKTEAATNWTDRMPINPDIDNLRVVSCKDKNMVNKNAPILNFAEMTVQNNAANTPVIHANMDVMAIALTQKGTAAEAWATIFRKPANKSWGQVMVALKVNAIAQNHPRIAVISKICMVLNQLGVPYGNMVVYDAAAHNAYPLYNSFVNNGLPTGVQVSNNHSLVGNNPVAYPLSVPGNHRCVAHLANGTVDILVNFAVNKGHSPWNGNCTLAMKNHYGTFSPNSASNNHSSIDYIYAINKSDAIIGGNPPRQQLCIVDSLWARNTGPSGEPDKNIYRLIMGTFAPAVDYLTVKKVRDPEMNVSSNNIVPTFLTSFGYTEAQRDALVTTAPAQNGGRGWVEVTPAAQTSTTHSPSSKNRQFSLKYSSAAGKPRLAFSTEQDGFYTAEIFTLKGELAARETMRVRGKAVFVFDKVKLASGSYTGRISLDGKVVDQCSFFHR